ncbi:MAG: magnesium chelatase subunit D [Gammaproteobacteria bacterium]
MSDAPDYAVEEPGLALVLLSVDPVGLGGISLRGMPGPGRNAALAQLTELANNGHDMLHVPINVSDDRLLGGLDIAATLRSGKPLVQRGLLERADGGLVVLAMAERLRERTVAVLCQAMDTQRLLIERDGLSSVRPCRFGVVALDESLSDDEFLASSLADRLAFALWTDPLSAADLGRVPFDAYDVTRARTQLADVQIGDDILEAITQAALALGIGSLRPALMAVTAARALAALNDARHVLPEHAAQAVRLTLSHRALTTPMVEPEDAEPPPPQQNEADGDEDTNRDQSDPTPGEMADSVVQAAQALLPDQLLRALAMGLPQKSRKVGRGEASRAALQRRGRPIGVRSVSRLGDHKLNILATAKAAAPWQRIRDAKPGRLKVYPDDFRITRYQTKTQNTTIFAVDASGSSAAQRLAEVKGAVELLLAECYVTRAQVAVVAFRKSHAEVLLPPTRSLTRAKRQLADLPGGGATPLAHAIDVTRELCEQVRRAGQQPSIVFLTDGRGNVGRDGTPGHPEATDHALAAARELRELNVGCVMVDTARRPRERARKMAEAMGAQYLPLPYADAGALATAVGQAA